MTIGSGKFGERWQDIYETYRVKQIRIDVAWGTAPTAEQVAQALRQNQRVSVVTLVHSETSTATACDLQAIAQAVRQHSRDALLIVDGITSVAALPLHMDEWGIDVLVTGSQKALMLPPGLGFVALGPRAVHRLGQVEPVGCYSLDLRRWLKSWRDHDVPFTPPVNLIRGQRLALEMIESQGIADVWARTAQLAQMTRGRLQSMGLQLISESPSDSLTGAFYPPGVDDGAFRAALREKHAIQIAGGQDGRGGQWKGRIFRISHMGYVDADDTRAALDAIETQLTAAGHVAG